MQFQAAAPHRALAPYVETYWQAFYPQEKIPEHVMPPLLPAMLGLAVVFSKESPFTATWPDGSKMQMPKAYIVSHLTKPSRLSNFGKHSLFGIQLKHDALFRIWGLCASEFVNKASPVFEVFDQLYHTFLQDILEADSLPKRVKLADSFLLKSIQNAAFCNNTLEKSGRLLVESSGFASMEQLAAEEDLGVRQFSRNFKQQFGLSPKTYASILRTNLVIRSLDAKGNVDWQGMIAQLHFFDQSHLIKDFKRFTGQTPQQYAASGSYQFSKNFMIS